MEVCTATHTYVSIVYISTYVRFSVMPTVCVYPFPCIVLHASGRLYSMACLITGWCTMYVCTKVLICLPEKPTL